jgi:putative NADH-flavin reductase
MKLTIVAATGGIGLQILQQAVAAGHDVTAVVRNPAKISADVRVVQADLSDPDPVTLAAAMEGADAVLSGLGGSSRADQDVAARGEDRRGAADHRGERGPHRDRSVTQPPAPAEVRPR